MQVLSKPDVAGLIDRSMADELPGGRGLAARQALLRSHATPQSAARSLRFQGYRRWAESGDKPGSVSARSPRPS